MTSVCTWFAALYLLLGTVRGQIVWEQIGPGSQFVTACMVFDGQNQRFLVVDGQPPQIKEWNGSAWQTIATAPFPVNLVQFRACYDTLRHRVVLVGVRVNGYPGYCILEWDGAIWYISNPPNLNPISWYGSAIWDPIRQKTIITDLLCREWDGTTLTDLGALPSSPYGLCFNPLSGRPLLPGNPPRELLPNNTWAALPPTVQGIGMNFSFHEPVGNTIQAVPSQGMGYLPEVWDGTSWQVVNVGTIASQWQAIHTVAHDPATNELRGICQAGTFRFVRGPSGSIAPFGTSCPGSLGVPSLSAAVSPYTTPVPVVGKSITFVASGLQQYPFGIRYFLLGFSNTSWGGTPLPLDLSVFGMPGCFMNQSYDHMEAPTSGGMMINVPGLSALVGVTFYVQAMGLELFGLGGPGVCMSPSLAATIGTRW